MSDKDTSAFTDELIIDNAWSFDRVRVCNIFGQTLKDVGLKGAQGTIISTNALSKGVYLIIFEGPEGERHVRKMIKE